MGLIKAGLGAAGSVLADQWKEYFYCEAIPADVLAVKGRKKCPIAPAITTVTKISLPMAL